MDDLYNIPLFEDISDTEFQWLKANSTDVFLEKGDYFFKIGEATDRFYVMLEGELQVSRMLNGVLTVVGTTPRGIIGGELTLLNGTVSEVNSQALMPSRLMVFDLQAFRCLFSECPQVGTRVLHIATQRMSGIASTVNQQEKLAALGKLSAGLAHELNNPASAAQRSAQNLREVLPRLQEQTLQLAKLGLNNIEIGGLMSFHREVMFGAVEVPILSPLEQSDREDEIGSWLEQHNIPDGWEIASTFVHSGITQDALTEMAGELSPDRLTSILSWLNSSLNASALLDEIEQSTHRISELVKSVKEYTYMDQGQVQEVDVARGLDNTLKMLNHKGKQVKVVREYDPTLPKIKARGGELNQVWTNLIDNALDAMNRSANKGGTLRLITRNEITFAMVEINDDGPGIPPDVIPHIFEPFFSTKDVGEGTGLGLDTAYRIIKQHNGTIEIQSKPGETRFIVRLPIS